MERLRTGDKYLIAAINLDMCGTCDPELTIMLFFTSKDFPYRYYVVPKLEEKVVVVESEPKENELNPKYRLWTNEV